MSQGQYVVLPPRGLSATIAETQDFLGQLGKVSGVAKTHAFGIESLPRPKIKVLDSIHETSAKMVEMSDESVAALRAQQPGLRVVPVVYFKPMRKMRPQIKSRTKSRRSKKAAAGGGARSTDHKFVLVDRASGNPVPGVHVIAFTDFANRVGDEETTNLKGEVRLDLGSATAKIEAGKCCSWRRPKRKCTKSFRPVRSG